MAAIGPVTAVSQSLEPQALDLVAIARLAAGRGRRDGDGGSTAGTEARIPRIAASLF